MNTLKPLFRLAALGGLAVTLSVLGRRAGDFSLAASRPAVEAPSGEVVGLASMTDRPLGQATIPAKAGGWILLTHLSEQNLPPQGGLPSGTTPPSASGATGSGASPGATPDENWERLPADSQSETSPSAADSGDAAGTATGTDLPSGSASPQPNALATEVVPDAGATPTAGTASDQASAPEGSPELAPGGDNPGPPPALDVSAVSFGPDLADQSLESEIKSADTPALAASLRFTEEGRKQLAGSQVDQALRSLARAVSIDPGNPYEYFYMGRAWMAKRNYEQALTFFKRAEIGATPQWLGEAVGFEGACYEELGKLEDALSAYRRALRASPDNLMARIGLGRLGGTMASDTSLDAPPPTDLALPPPPGSDIGPPPVEESPPAAAPSDPTASSPDTNSPPKSAPSESSPSD